MSGAPHVGTTMIARAGPQGCAPRSHSMRRTLVDTGSAGAPPRAMRSPREQAATAAAPSRNGRRAMQGRTRTSIVACGGRGGAGRANQVDERGVAREAIAKRRSDRVQIGGRERGEMSGRLAYFEVEVAFEADLAGAQEIEWAAWRAHRVGALGTYFALHFERGHGLRRARNGVRAGRRAW